MKWSWKLVRLAGIDVFVHATFVMLIVWIAMIYWDTGGGLDAVARGVGFILALFACVLLHEFGHALTARRYGIRTRYITLLPIGGVAMLERMPDDPKQEMRVALAGPAVNLVLAGLLWIWLWAQGTLLGATVDHLDPTGGPLLGRLMAVNVMLAVFNLLPAFPMDGGRVLRALLAQSRPRGEATRLAASVGQALALLLGLLGLLYNPFLIFIALFVWIGAAAEAGSEEAKAALAGTTVGGAMLTDYRTLSIDDPLDRAIELTLAGTQKDFPVLQRDSLVGVLLQADLFSGLRRDGGQARVGDLMHRAAQTADINEPLTSVLQRLQGSECRLLSVTSAGRMVGIVDLDNIIELIKIQSALHGRNGAAERAR